MINKKFQVYFDCGFSKIRAGAFNKDTPDETFSLKVKFFLIIQI